MEQLFLVVAALACPVGMGLMMWFMMRGGSNQPATPDQERELASLRAQIDALRPAATGDGSSPRVPRPGADPVA
jgi:hypothetical protein